MMLRSFFWGFMVIFLVGCSQSVSDYQNSLPEFEPETYFNGKIDVWGVVSDRSGKVNRRFTASIDASWKNDQGVLEEVFTFDDGQAQLRTWKITQQKENLYAGTAGDVIGVATGEKIGFVMNWQYKMVIDAMGGEWQVVVDDWLYQIDDRVVLGIGEISKFGLKLGEITLFMMKQSDLKE